LMNWIFVASIERRRWAVEAEERRTGMGNGRYA